MKRLIIDPSKISLNSSEENVFLQGAFLNYLDNDRRQKINYSILSKTKLDIDSEIKQAIHNREIYDEVLQELFPILNKLNKINWNYKTWNFFIGPWLNNYIAVIRNRIDLIKPLINSDINYEEQIRIGRNTSLTCNDIRHFTYKCSLIEWNEKLFSRIIYIMHSQNFINDASLLNPIQNTIKKKEGFLNKINYILKINIIKFFERVICFNNNYLFYNSYINNKNKLYKIILKLRDVPFIYSFAFFNNKIINEEINFSLRKKININFESKNLDIKILKFLLIELLPTIYLEGFQQQKKLAENSHLPKKIKKVFITHAYSENSFKFWLADQINGGTKLIHGQHGAGHNIYKEFFGDFHEINISEKYFTWGWKIDNKKVVPVGNYLINKRNKFNSSYNKNILLVLPTANIFKRDSNIYYADSLAEDAKEYQKFVDSINPGLLNSISIRNHPQKVRRELDFINFISYDRKKIKNTNPNISFDKLIKNQGLVIFNYLSTEFFKLMSLNIPCILLLNKNMFNYMVVNEVKNDFHKLSSIGIFHTDGASLAKEVNKISNNIESWWNNKKSIKIKNEFCAKHSNPNFDTQLFIKELNKL